MTDEEQARADKLFDELGMKTTFVPWSLSRHAGKKRPCLNWKIVLSRPGRSAKVETDYCQGIGHIPNFRTYPGHPTMDEDAYMKNVAERGKYYEKGLPSSHSLALNLCMPTPLPPPKKEDVLGCLLMDAEALDHPDFESWAEEYGYDEDSRKAEAIYNACLAGGLRLRALLGEEGLRLLGEKLRDV